MSRKCTFFWLFLILSKRADAKVVHDSKPLEFNLLFDTEFPEDSHDSKHSKYELLEKRDLHQAFMALSESDFPDVEEEIHFWADTHSSLNGFLYDIFSTSEHCSRIDLG